MHGGAAMRHLPATGSSWSTAAVAAWAPRAPRALLTLACLAGLLWGPCWAWQEAR